MWVRRAGSVINLTIQSIIEPTGFYRTSVSPCVIALRKLQAVLFAKLHDVGMAATQIVVPAIECTIAS